MTKKARPTKTKIPRAVSQGRQPFAKQQIATLVYCEQVPLTLSSGAYQEYKLSCNGMFDPNISGSGHQPLYFDQLMAIYDHYCVTQSTITISPIPSTTTQAWTTVLFQDDDTSTSTTSVATAMERPGAVYTQCAAQASAPYPTSLTNTWKASQVFAGNPLSREDLCGSASANPAEETWWIICANDAALAGSTIIYNVKISYTATFYELKSIASS